MLGSSGPTKLNLELNGDQFYYGKLTMYYGSSIILSAYSRMINPKIHLH